MATVNKDFRVKNGLVVEGTTGTINDSDIITESKLTGGSNENITVTYEDGVVSFVVAEGAGTVIDDAVTNGAAASSGASLAYDSETNALSVEVSDQFVRDQVSAGDGLSYDDQSGEFSADLGDGLGFAYDTSKIEVAVGNGIEIGEAGEVQIDTSVTVDLDSAQALSNKELGTDLDADGFQIVNLGTPQNAGDAATKAYVDAVSEGLHIHASVAVATDEDITLSPAPATIDGVTLTVGMRVLVKDQENKSENGIYVLNDEGDLVRAEDHDTAAEVQAGDFVFVQSGTIYGATGWVQTNTVNTLGTDAIEWTQFSGSGTFTAGNGLNLDGTEFEIDTAVTVDVDTEQTLTNKTIDGGDNTLTNIANESLSNDSITINSYETALGESVTLVTDDVAEGYDAVNLYFTDQRAVDAIEDASELTLGDIKVETIEIDGHVANWAYSTSIATAETPTTIAFFPIATYRTAKFLVKVSSGTHTQVSEVLVTLDTSDNIAITEYAVVSTNGSLGTITATENGTDLQLVFEATETNNTVKVFGTLIK